MTSNVYMVFRWLFCVFLTLLLAHENLAQSKYDVFEFSDEICSYKGYFDTSKYSKKELTGTRQLINFATFFDGDDVEELEKQYIYKVQKLESLHIVSAKYFKSIQTSLKRDLDESYNIKRLLLLSEDDPKILLRHFEKDSIIQKYAVGLVEGGDKLIDAYEFLVKQQMKQNADPKSIWAEFQQNLKSDEIQSIAFDAVLNYGWWNATNHHIYHHEFSHKAVDEFFGLFNKLERFDCDIP